MRERYESGVKRTVGFGGSLERKANVYNFRCFKKKNKKI